MGWVKGIRRFFGLNKQSPFNINRRERMLNAQDVAEYFLSLSDEESGDYISNLKLQKLVYLAQGCNLAVFDKPLFNDRIEAWLHGPVVRELYNNYKQHGAYGIPSVKVDLHKYPEGAKELLNEVYKEFGQYSAYRLRDITHKHTPWMNAQSPTGNREIPREDMRDYFKRHVLAND